MRLLEKGGEIVGEALHRVRQELLAGKSTAEVESIAVVLFGVDIWTAMTLVDEALADIERGM